MSDSSAPSLPSDPSELSSEQVAERLGVSMSTLKNWAVRLPVPSSLGPDGTRRFPASAVEVLEAVKHLRDEERSYETIRRAIAPAIVDLDVSTEAPATEALESTLEDQFFPAEKEESTRSVQAPEAELVTPPDPALALAALLAARLAAPPPVSEAPVEAIAAPVAEAPVEASTLAAPVIEAVLTPTVAAPVIEAVLTPAVADIEPAPAPPAAPVIHAVISTPVAVPPVSEPPVVADSPELESVSRTYPEPVSAAKLGWAETHSEQAAAIAMQASVQEPAAPPMPEAARASVDDAVGAAPGDPEILQAPAAPEAFAPIAELETRRAPTVVEASLEPLLRSGNDELAVVLARVLEVLNEQNALSEAYATCRQRVGELEMGLRVAHDDRVRLQAELAEARRALGSRELVASRKKPWWSRFFDLD